MIKKNIKKEMDEYFKKDKTQEIQQISNNIDSKINKNVPNDAFINPNTNPKLILDYIPQELFMSFKKKNIIVNENNQINEKSFSPQIDNKFDIDNNNSKNNLTNNILSSNEINKLKNKNVCENNHFNSLYFNDKNKELETSKKNNSNTNTDTKNKYDFQITDNRFNISELFTNNKDKNNNINNDSIKQNIKNNNLPTNSSKDTPKNANKRYNEDISYFDSFDINKNINSNISNNNNIIKNNILNNNIINNLLSSNSSYNNSTCNGYSDHYINSVLNISNTLTNNSNYYSNSLCNNYGEKNKLRNIENREKMLFEMENERQKKINELIEEQKNMFLQKEKENEEKALMEEEKRKKEELKELEAKDKTDENFKNNYNNNNDKENYNDNFFISKEKESCYDNIRSNRKNQEKAQTNNGSNKDKRNQNIDCNNQFNNNQNDLKHYFRNVKNENINSVEKTSNRINYNNNNYNYFFNNSNDNKEANSFNSKNSQIVSPFISSVITDNNLINKTSQNFSKNNKKNFKSTKNFSKNSKTSNKIKNLGNGEDYQTSSLQMLNLLNNDNKYETCLINEIIRSDKQNKLKRNKSKRDFNFVGKEKIAKKYNLYFNCFDPKLYEEQREKLLKDKKSALKMKKSKSVSKILILDDYIGPNLYNEQIENPDIGYIIYKTNKKINSNYSLNSMNTLNSNYRNYNNNDNQKIFYDSSQSLKSIETYKNNGNKLYF